MAENSKIEWTDHTFNPWRGCAKVSDGCLNCYAETLSHQNPSVLGEWGPLANRAIAAEDYWRLPVKWNAAASRAGERRRVFCLSLGDIFEARQDLAAPRARLGRLILGTPWLDWLLLTKRPGNWQAMLAEMWDWWQPSLPLPWNVWIGATVENRKHGVPRIEVLRQIPASVRFLSVEPLLEDLGELDLTGIDWVIIGGESGRKARSSEIAWHRSVIAQCRRQGVAPFEKQFGAHVCSDDASDALFSKLGRKYALRTILLADKKGGDWEEWPEDLRVREFPVVRPLLHPLVPRKASEAR